MAAKSVDNSRPCELDVSHSGSPSDRNAAPALPMCSISSSNSLVDRPSRSSLVTTTMSPGVELRHQLGKLRPIGPDAAYLLAKDSLGAGMLERFELAGQVLVLGANPRVSHDSHFSPLLQISFANCKPLKMRGQGLFAKLPSFANCAKRIAADHGVQPPPPAALYLIKLKFRGGRRPHFAAGGCRQVYFKTKRIAKSMI